ncbi:hypothetical protein [Klugiella xanthotipulae]|uniref:hypothetical protein n=1 Tax=Klugiella xanthotipulae TaxID=244735 RepID=UPI00115017AF|nr:hypothetical protein [Klugiella xanthotipulae]
MSRLLFGNNVEGLVHDERGSYGVDDIFRALPLLGCVGQLDPRVVNGKSVVERAPVFVKGDDNQVSDDGKNDLVSVSLCCGGEHE